MSEKTQEPGSFFRTFLIEVNKDLSFPALFLEFDEEKGKTTSNAQWILFSRKCDWNGIGVACFCYIQSELGIDGFFGPERQSGKILCVLGWAGEVSLILVAIG